MTVLNHHDIMQLNGRYRANLINTASGPRSVCLVGTTNEEGQHNLAIFNTVTHIGANPPFLGLIMRPHTVDRHTLENIQSLNRYTISHVCSEWVERAHLTSGKYDRDYSEFDAAALTPSLDNDNIPYVQESKISMSLKLQEIIPIKANDTMLIVGSVTELRVDEQYIRKNGSIDLAGAGSVAIGGLYDYYDIQPRHTAGYVVVKDNKAL